MLTSGLKALVKKFKEESLKIMSALHVPQKPKKKLRGLKNMILFCGG